MIIIKIKERCLFWIYFSYTSTKDENYVEYKDFCREVERAFGNDQLEKNPLIQSNQHNPQVLNEYKSLSPDEQDRVLVGLKRIAERVLSQILF